MTFRLREDDDNLYIEFIRGMDKWALIYKKSNDRCILLRNTKVVDTKKLHGNELTLYEEVLDYAIAYYHEKGDALLH